LCTSKDKKCRNQTGLRECSDGATGGVQDKRNMQIIETLENRKDAVKVSELARLLSVTPKHIYKTRAAGRIPGAFRVNRALRFDPQILAEWLKRRAHA
jgi:predicted DNA-binding transcriptional regulator AlpA